MLKIEDFSIYIYLHVAFYLNGPSGLLEFALTNKHMWSSAMNEVARQLIEKLSTAEERIGNMHIHKHTHNSIEYFSEF